MARFQVPVHQKKKAPIWVYPVGALSLCALPRPSFAPPIPGKCTNTTLKPFPSSVASTRQPQEPVGASPFAGWPSAASRNINTQPLSPPDKRQSHRLNWSYLHLHTCRPNIKPGSPSRQQQWNSHFFLPLRYLWDSPGGTPEIHQQWAIARRAAEIKKHRAIFAANASADTGTPTNNL